MSLGEREAGPMPDRSAFGPVGDLESKREYLRAWRLWYAIQRDAVLNADEFYARFEARLECYAAEWRRR